MVISSAFTHDGDRRPRLSPRVPCVMGAALLAAALSAGCVPKRVHVSTGLEGVQRVAVVDVSTTDRAHEAGEYFTNEFVSLGYEVVERANLGQIIKEGFSKSDYLDQETLAAWGRGKAVQAVVLFKLVGAQAPADPERSSPIEVSGWVRIVDVQTGVILMGYNATYDMFVSGRRGSREFEAYQRYAELVVDNIREALKAEKITPPKPTFEVAPAGTGAPS